MNFGGIAALVPQLPRESVGGSFPRKWESSCGVPAFRLRAVRSRLREARPLADLT